MTKKDYIIIAKCLNEIYAPANMIVSGNYSEKLKDQAYNRIGAIMAIVEQMFVEFAKDNEKFDWQKFKKAVYK